MTGWQVLKLALDYYWGFFKENPFIGLILTLSSFHYTVAALQTIRGVRRSAGSHGQVSGTVTTVTQPAPVPDQSPPPPEPQKEPDTQSRYERLMGEDQIR